MNRKNWKKIIAICLVAVIVLAGVPKLPSHVLADTADTTSETGTEGAAGTDGTVASDGTAAADGAGGTDNASGEDAASGEEGKDEKDSQQIKEDGEVVMDGAVGKVDKSKWITKKDYEFITKSDRYKMYLYKPRLSILLEDRKTGKIIESTLSDEKDDGNSNASWNGYMKSGIVISAIIGIKNTYQVDLITAQNTIQINKNDKGFSADITFPEYGFSLTVNVTLENDQLVVNIPDSSIQETKEGTYISTITMFPFMGYTFLDEKEGYMLIPDGNGALINLDNKEGRYVTGFSQMIYGNDAGFVEADKKEYLWDEIDMLEDANRVLAPIFGMAHTKEHTGYLGIVEKGEKRASIVAEPNGVMVNYNRCFARFLLRDVYVQPLNTSNSGTMRKPEDDRTHSDLQVRYLLLSENEADYSTMAVKYRQYLLDNGLITVKDNSYKTRVDFLGTDREEFLLGTRAVTMTRIDDIAEIYSELQSSGVSSLMTLYKGWQSGGVYNLPISSYKADSKIGGTSKLTRLVKDSAGKNYELYLYADALRMNPSNHKLSFDMIKRINKRTFAEEIWAEVYDTFYYLIPESSVEDFKSLVEDAKDDEVNNIALCGISNTMFSYSYKGDFYTRNDTAKVYEDALKEVASNTNLVMEQPCAYLWNNTNAFLDMPLGSSDYMYIDEEIPFLSMVLKGIIPMYSDYVNFEANKQEFFLQMIEAGVYPSFYLTKEDSSDLIYTNSAYLYSTTYSTYKDLVVEYDKQFREFSKLVDGANMVRHEKLDNGITKVTYSNGVTVYINYTGASQTMDGITVEAMSYSYKAGEAE